MKKISKFLFGTYARTLVVLYFSFAFVGALLLMLPISRQSGMSLSFVDALFTTMSATSVTGLTTINVAQTFTTFGHVILVLIMQLGGLGILMILVSYWLLLGKKIGFKHRHMLFAEQNQVSMSGIIKLIKNILAVLFVSQIIGFIMMAVYLAIVYRHIFGIGGAVFQAFFLSVSLVTNAGIDIDPGTSMFRYANDYYMQTIGIILMFVGSVGFWPLAEFKQWLGAKKRKEVYRVSYLSSVIFKMHLTIWLVSAGLFIILEFNHFLVDKALIEGIYYALFQTLSTRNSGFTTMNIHELSAATHTLFTALMFIGASPNSAGGGVRTSAFVIALVALYSFAIGREQVIIGKKAIRPISVLKSFMVIFGALVLVMSVTVLLFATQTQLHEDPHMYRALLFEVASAFGTTGQSLGITHLFDSFGKSVLIFVMFVGRVGVLTLLLLLNTKKAKNNIRYTEAEIMVG